MSVTLLHLANTRLGTTFTTLGAHGREHRTQMLSTFSSLADMAASMRVHAVLISGDIFDCAVPAPKTVQTVQRFFTKLRNTGIPAVILPGARDPEGVADPTRWPDGQDPCPGALVLTPVLPSVYLEAIGLVVRSLTLQATIALDNNAMTPGGTPTASDNAIVVGLAYRHAGDTWDLPHLAHRLAGSSMRYLGIGGDCEFVTYSEGNVTVCAPGVPEPLDWGQERGSVALVHIDDNGAVRVERRRTGSHSFVRRELPISEENAHTIAARVERMAHPTLALEIVLTGTCPFDVLIDPAAIEAELAPQFFHLRVIDRTEVVYVEAGSRALSPGTILGNFARVMDGRLRDAADEEQAILEREAYKLGLSMLQGGRSEL